MCTENHCEHDHEHHHDHHDHHHDHNHDHHHDHTQNIELAKDFYNTPVNRDNPVFDAGDGIGEALKEFTKIIHKLDSPVDFYENNKEFRGKCHDVGIILRWGIKASKYYDHAYILDASEAFLDVFTILSKNDLSFHDDSVFPWASYDIIED